MLFFFRKIFSSQIERCVNSYKYQNSFTPANIYVSEHQRRRVGNLWWFLTPGFPQDLTKQLILERKNSFFLVSLKVSEGTLFLLLPSSTCGPDSRGKVVMLLKSVDSHDWSFLLLFCFAHWETEENLSKGCLLCGADVPKRKYLREWRSFGNYRGCKIPSREICWIVANHGHPALVPEL